MDFLTMSVPTFGESFHASIVKQFIKQQKRQKMTSLGDTVTSKEAAEILNTSEVNIRQLVFRKLLTPVGKEKRRTQFSRSEVEALGKRRQP